MASGVNETAVLSGLKKYYSKKHRASLVSTNNPFYADLKPDTNAGADKYVLALQHLDLPTDSATFADAQTAAGVGSLGFAKFEIPMVRHYVPVRIDNLVLRGAQKDPHTFFNMLTTHIDGAFRRFANVMGMAAWRTGYGGIGKVVANAGAVNYFDLVNKEDSIHFIPGQLLQFAASDSAACRASGNFVTVAKVNSNSGRITIVEADFSAAVTGVLAGDTVYVKGNRFITGSAAPKMGTGFLAYCPQSGVGSSSLHGLDTTTSDMLYGRRVGAKSSSVRDALITAAMEIVRVGGAPARAYLPMGKYVELLKEMESDKHFVNHETRAGISFSALVLHVPGVGTVPVISDPKMPADVGAVVTDDWHMPSIGKAPDYLDLTNGGKLFLPAEDGSEIRVGGYYNYGCSAPGHQAVLDFAND